MWIKGPTIITPGEEGLLYILGNIMQEVLSVYTCHGIR